MSPILMKPNESRILFDCAVKGIFMTMLVDTGSPNTLVPFDFIERTKLTPVKNALFKGTIMGYTFEKRPAVVIPEIVLPNRQFLKNVRAIAALYGDDFRNTIILGMNVLNHGITRIEREGDSGTFDFLQSLTSQVEGSERSAFNHLIIGGKYLTTDAGADEPKYMEVQQ